MRTAAGDFRVAFAAQMADKNKIKRVMNLAGIARCIRDEMVARKQQATGK
jgi:hypothetical protein